MPTLTTPTERAVPAAGRTPAATVDDDVSVIGVAVALLRSRRLLVGTAAAVFTVVVGVTLLLPRTYTSTAMFLPNAGTGTMDQLSGLAAQVGFTLPRAQGQAPDFYVDLLRSRDIVSRLVEHEYSFSARVGLPFFRDSVQRRGTLIQLFQIDTADGFSKARDLAIEELMAQMRVNVALRTGVVTLQVQSPWPALSHAIVDRTLQLVTEYNQSTRQTQATAERLFVQGRLVEVQQEQRDAEDQLQRFLQGNRDFRNAPSLQFEHDRLAREVELRRQVVLTLSQAFEQSRIEEVRNTPVITMVQNPEIPARPDRRRLFLKGLLAILVGLTAGAAIAVGRESLAGPARTGGRNELVEEWRNTTRALRHLVSRKAEPTKP